VCVQARQRKRDNLRKYQNRLQRHLEYLQEVEANRTDDKEQKVSFCLWRLALHHQLLGEAGSMQMQFKTRSDTPKPDIKTPIACSQCVLEVHQ
jgi:hypothetical protein